MHLSVRQLYIRLARSKSRVLVADKLTFKINLAHPPRLTTTHTETFNSELPSLNTQFIITYVPYQLSGHGLEGRAANVQCFNRRSNDELVLSSTSYLACCESNAHLTIITSSFYYHELVLYTLIT